MAGQLAGADYPALAAGDAGKGVLWNGSAWVSVDGGLPQDSPKRSSDCSTVPRELLSVAVGAPASGSIIFARAVCVKNGAFTKIRFATGSTTPSGLTQVRLGVWTPAAGAKQAETADLSATITAANTLYDNLALGSTVNLTLGQAVYLGIVFVGTTPPNLRGASQSGNGVPGSSINALAPRLSGLQTGYASGALPDITSITDAANVPWIELVA